MTRVDRRTIEEAVDDPDRLPDLLDAVAADAADGSQEALDTLLWAIDRLALARGVVQRVVVNDPDVDDVAQDVLVASPALPGVGVGRQGRPCGAGGAAA